MAQPPANPAVPQARSTGDEATVGNVSIVFQELALYFRVRTTVPRTLQLAGTVPQNLCVAAIAGSTLTTPNVVGMHCTWSNPLA